MSLLFTLVIYNLRLIPLRVWLLLGLICFLQVGQIRLNDNWTLYGHSFTNLNGMIFLFYAVMAGAYFRENSNSNGGLVPSGEFLVSHAVLRRVIYLSRVILFFGLMLAGPLLEYYIKPAKPDLKIDFCVGQNDEKSNDQKFKFYQAVFPDSSFVSGSPRYKPAGYDKTLRIPSGARLLAHWDLLVAISIALFIQLNMLYASPSRTEIFGFYGTLAVSYFGVSILFNTIFPRLGVSPGPSLFESAFFFFAQHPIQTWLFVLGIFVIVQLLALRQVRNVEFL